MKLVDGGSLGRCWTGYTDDPRAAAELVAEAAEAVAHAHARGILHRDLKPANILVDDRGPSARHRLRPGQAVEADVELTQSGAILGTPGLHVARAGQRPRAGRSPRPRDVYGLGAVLYALLTGRAPFGGDTVVETLDAGARPAAPSRRGGSTPRSRATWRRSA